MLLTAFHPSCNLLGISSVSGNASIAHTTSNTLALLSSFGLTTNDVPVVRGASSPLTRPIKFAPEIHGKTGLDGVPLLPSVQPSMVESVPSGVQHIAEAILKEERDQVWIVATGPLTTVALLFRDFPEVRAHIRGLSVMGGAVGHVPVSRASSSTSTTTETEIRTEMKTAPFSSTAPPHRRDGKGNWTPHAEFNIWCDPEAASQVLCSLQFLRKPIILIPLDLTHQVRGTADVQVLLFPSKSKSKIREMFKQILLYFASTYSEHSGIHDGPPLHDPLAVFAVLEADAFDDWGGERWDVSVDCSEGPRAGETVAVSVRRQEGDELVGGGVKIPRSVDLKRFWGAVDDALSAVEKKLNGQVNGASQTAKLAGVCE